MTFGMIRLCVLCTAAAALFALSGCAADKNLVRVTAAPPEQPAVICQIPQPGDTLERKLEEADRYTLALNHFVLARDYERRGMHDMAQRLFETAYDFWPKPSFLRRMLIDRYTRSREHEKIIGLFFRDGETIADLTPEDKQILTIATIGFYNGVLARDPQNEEALRSLAHLYIAGERYEEAAYYYRRLTQIDGIGAIYRRGLALLLFQLKDYENAERLFDELIQETGSGPENAENLPMPQGAGKQELYLYRGAIYSQTKRFEEAAADFRAALAINPRYEDAWKELCYVYMLSKDTVKARAAVDEYMAAFPESGSAWRFNGYIFNMERQFDDAITALQKAIEIDSTDYFGWFKLGSVFERQKRIDEAADAFRAALKIRPGDGQVSNYLGYMWADANMNLDSAKILIEAALKEEPLNGAYLDSYAWVFYRMGDFEKALHYMNKAIEQVNNDPDFDDDPVLYEHLGDILFQLRDYPGALAAYERSLELETEAAERIKGRLDEIRKFIRRAGP
jgi:tetratricopeptide (TPR) repeat protein